MTIETKTSLNPETLNALQDLFAMTQGSASFYEEAESQAADPVFASLFAYLATQRTELRDELAACLRANGQEPTQGGTVVDALHQTWMKMRAVINSGDYRVLLIEAERAEDRIGAGYVRVIKETAGSAMNAVLLGHYAKVKQAHDRIKGLRTLTQTTAT